MTNQEVVKEWGKLDFICKVLDNEKIVFLFTPFNLCEEVHINNVNGPKVYNFLSKERDTYINKEKNISILYMPFITQEGYLVIL